MKLRIVEVEGERYAVQQQHLMFGAWEWLSLTEYSTWTPRFVGKYCLGSLEQAEKALELHIKEIKMKEKLAPRIIKVVKTVRV